MTTENLLRVSEAMISIERVKDMSPRDRQLAVLEAEIGGNWADLYNHICSVVDPMDVMTDIQIFGVAIPWENDAVWRR